MIFSDKLMKEADVYLSASLSFETWGSSEPSVQQRALITAIRQIETVTQKFQVPEEVLKKATFEQAVFLLDADMQDAVKTRQKGISNVLLGNVSESYKDSIPTEMNGIVLSSMSNAVLQPYIGRRKIQYGRLVP